jgi:hypothetical protein
VKYGEEGGALAFFFSALDILTRRGFPSSSSSSAAAEERLTAGGEVRWVEGLVLRA